MSESTPPASFVAPDTAQLAPLFPGYEIECLIATGGMGAVYRAIQKSLDRKVAIKILPREFSNDEAFCQGFEAEAKAMARLNHPNLIGVYDFGEVDGMLYIIMEYVPGKSLFDSSHGKALNPSEAVRLISGICNGLAHAHENRILHRDIKPSNILLDLNAEPKIGDFGLARPIERKIQEGEQIFGTPHYTAPEVVDRPHSVDHRADIFSVGVMLHELLTGKLPADDQRPASAIIRCDPRFDAIIRRATNPLPDLRYPNAAEITRELAQIVGSSGPRGANKAPGPGPKPGGAKIGAPKSAPVRGPLPPRPPAPKAKSSSSASGILMLIAAIILLGFTLVKYGSLLLSKPAAKPVVPSTQPELPKPSGKPADSSSRPSWGDSSSSSGGKSDNGTQASGSPSWKPDPITPRTDTSNAGADEQDSKSDNASTGPAIPKFDVDDFLLNRALKVMKERAAPTLAGREKALGDNLKSFEREVKRLIRRIESRDDRDEAEEDLADFLKACATDGLRLPAKLGTLLSGIDYVEDAYDEHVDKQKTIEANAIASLNQLSATYILGIEKQIERLKAANDPAAAELLAAEISKTRDNPTHFPYLMLGIDPEAEKAEDGKKDGGKDEEIPLKPLKPFE